MYLLFELSCTPLSSIHQVLLYFWLLESSATHDSLVAVVWSLSHVQLFETAWTAAHQAFLSFTISRSLLKLMSIESVKPSNHLFLYSPLLLLPSIFSRIRVFSSESAVHIRWPKYWSFSFSISPSNEYSGLSSFRINWFDLLAVHGTLKSLLQNHQFFGAQPSLWSNYHICIWLQEKNHSLQRNILKSRDITLPTKVHLVKAMVFPVVMYGCESWTMKKAECCRIDIFELWCWRRLLKVPWTARRSNQSILKEISPGCLLEGLMLKLKL